MAFKYEKQFRKEKPETVGESDAIFDLDNYREWLEDKIEVSHELLESVVELQEQNYGNGSATHIALVHKSVEIKEFLNTTEK
jgi:hypothetical protein